MTTSHPHPDRAARTPPPRALRGLLLALLAAASLFAAAPASAQSCWISIGATISFGEVGPAGRDTSSPLNVTCQRNWTQFTYFRLCMAIPGGSPSPDINPRQMSNYNGAQMAYDLYSDPARTRLIGPFGSGYPLYTATLAMNALFDFEETVNMPIYARAHPGQNLPATHPYQSQIGGGQVRYSYNVASLFNPNPGFPSEAQCLSGTGTTGSGIVGFHTGVHATFANACRITTATDLDFGAVAALTGNRDQTSTIQLQCPAGTAWRVGLDNGLHAVGDTRRMAGPGGNHLAYELYRDPQRTQRWGNTPGADTSDGTGDDGSQSLTVHGRVPAQPSPVPGSYSDTVTVTLTF